MLAHGEAPLAYGLTRGMARVIGVDLIKAVKEGWMPRGQLEDLVDTCAACPLFPRCTQWLASTVSAPSLPVYCRNKTDLEALRYN